MDTGSNGNALAVVEPVSNSLEANVGVLMRRATDVAGVCREVVTKTAQTIQGRKYVRVEGWQAIAVAYGCVASARDVEVVYAGTGAVLGIKAVGEVRRMSDGAVISTAEGFVGEDEPVWAGGGVNQKTGKPYERRPDYARRAMAQTRAVSRACRGAFSFVVTLIDERLSTTPAEEMEGIVVEGSTTPPPPRGTEALRNAMAGPPPSPPHTVAGAVTQHVEQPRIPPPRDSAENRGEPPQHDQSLSFRFGKDKGVPLAQLGEGSLKFYENCLKNDLTSSDPKKQQFSQANTLALANVQAELRYRGL